MKARLVSFQNYGKYIEYAVKVKAHWWSRWHYYRNAEGHRALFRFVDADALCVKINGKKDE